MTTVWCEKKKFLIRYRLITSHTRLVIIFVVFFFQFIGQKLATFFSAPQQQQKMGQARSQFTDEELQDYEDLTFFTKKEILV